MNLLYYKCYTLQVLIVQLQVQVPVQIIQVQPNCQTNKHAVELNEQNIL